MRYWSSIFYKLVYGPSCHPHLFSDCSEVYWGHKEQKTDKASVPDGIPPRFLKEFADELAPVLCRLFRLILISCT